MAEIRDVRSTVERGHQRAQLGCPLRAKLGQSTAQRNIVLFDYLVSGDQQILWQRDAECLREIAIEYELVFGRFLNCQSNANT